VHVIGNTTVEGLPAGLRVQLTCIGQMRGELAALPHNACQRRIWVPFDERVDDLPWHLVQFQYKHFIVASVLHSIDLNG